MPDQQSQPDILQNKPPPKSPKKRRNSISFKMLSIGFLVLILLIPASMIQLLIQDRKASRNSAIEEISEKWGQRQTISGPVLTLPYTDKNSTEKRPAIKYAHFMPDSLNINGDVDAKARYRSIYKAVLYTANLKVKGAFNQPDIAFLKDKNVQWEEAFLTVGIPDMQGINENIKLQWNEESFYFNPGVQTNNLFYAGVNIPVPISDPYLTDSTAGDIYNFAFDLDLNGSSSLSFTPLGKETNVALKSAWPNPSFDGAFLPDEREITNNGFTANWKVLHLNRNYPQKWKGAGFKIGKSSFGLRLIEAVDEYQKNMRSSKYAVMFLALTFMVFFFVEVQNKTRIHPIQYLLVGLALCLFYLLLLSLSEHFTFDFAYLMAAVPTVGLITLYSLSIFSNKKMTFLMGGILTILYGYLFSLLQLDAYALLLGSLGLFVILAIVMYVSRNISWYAYGNDDEEGDDDNPIFEPKKEIKNLKKTADNKPESLDDLEAELGKFE